MPETQVLSSEAPHAGAPRRWARFLTGLLGIMLFAFGAIPALERLGPAREVRDATRKAGIDATALFYTESDVSGEAEASIRNAIKYPAHRDRPPIGSKSGGSPFR
ncbi:MAG: hypothetical protein ABIK89_06205 [Planctomycetota bacterium]